MDQNSLWQFIRIAVKVMAINNIFSIISTYHCGNKITEELKYGPKMVVFS